MLALVGSWEKVGLYSSAMFEKINLILNRKLEYLQKNSKEISQNLKDKQEESKKLKHDYNMLTSNSLSKSSFKIREKFSSLKEESQQLFAEIGGNTEVFEESKTKGEILLGKNIEELKALRGRYLDTIELAYKNIIEVKSSLSSDN